MKLQEISKPITTAVLNENIAKMFGQKIDTDQFTLEQLQDVRNKVRTKPVSYTHLTLPTKA